jgi:DNA-binding response OmpR family regulator
MIEDDQRLAAMVGDYLAGNGYAFDHAPSGMAGLERLQAKGAAISAILLDLMLPDLDGLEICRRIRAQAPPLNAVPLVMLTAKGDPLDRVVGLELGADDYLPKPFEPRELLARLRAALRRPGYADGPGSALLRFGRLEVDPDARSVLLDGRMLILTAYQFDLLVALAQRAGRVLSREHLLDAVKGQALEAFDRSIDVHIARLRALIEDDPRRPKRIITVRGAGYVFAKLQDG